MSLMVALAAMAEGVDRNAALQKAQRFMPGKQFVEGKTPPSARANAPQKHDAFYVFNAKDGDGFVIVSGDDRTTEILGYSKHHNLDMDNLPENLKWWLDSYARQIKALESSSVPAAHNAAPHRSPAIATLIQSAWNQNPPYNYMCPDGNYVDYDEPGYNAENRCVTGCVATAMAQVMYYWKWPETCPALEGYQTDDLHTIKALPATTFEWDKMKNEYDWGETGPAADAVAKLMRYCGQAVHMNYSTGASGAYLSPAVLASVFQYSPNCQELNRDGYTLSQWETILLDELAAKRPVLYCGFTKYGGHQFVVDGYDGSGLFHINWGWGYISDSYYVLSATDLYDEQAIEYQYDQMAIVGVKPVETGEVMLPEISVSIDRQTPTIFYNRTSENTDFTDVSIDCYVQARYLLEPSAPLDMEFGWGLFKDDVLQQVLDNKTFNIPATSWWNSSYNASLSFGAGLADGQYVLGPIYRLPNDTQWTICGGYELPQFYAEVKGNSLKVGVPLPPFMSFDVNSIAVGEEPSKNDVVEVTANITNNSGINLLYAGLWIKSENSPWTNVMVTSAYIDMYSSVDINLSFVPEEAGIYQIKITAGGSEEALSTTTVKVADSGNLTVEGVNYLCIPDYKRAKVIRQENGSSSQNSLTVLPTVTYDGVDCKVLSIDDYAFYNINGVTSLTISEGVETLGNYAFNYMYNLKRLELPNSLKGIGENVIYGDDNLIAVVSHITEPFAVSDYTFARQQWNNETAQWVFSPSAATLYVPFDTKAKYEALSGWTWFANIEEGELKETMVDGLRYTYSTGSSTATVVQDDSYQELTEVTIPASVSISGRTYRVKAVGNEAFYGCWNLSSLTLPEGLESIGSNAFRYSNIKKLFIPEGVETIGKYAFSYMYSLTKLELPGTLKEIGENVIQGDDELTEVVSHIEEPFTISDRTFASERWNSETEKWEYSPSPATLYVPIGTKTKYDALSGWTWFSKIEEGEPKEMMIAGLKYSYGTGGTSASVVQDDSYNAFTEVTIPATVSIDGKTYNVTAVGNEAFYGCWNLSSLTLPEGLESIGSNAFRYSNIKKLFIPEGVETIGKYAFSYMYSLTKLELPGTLKEIGENVIQGDDELTEVVSHIEEPFTISDRTFASERWNSETEKWEYSPSPATLYVPIGTKTKYDALSGWTWFSKIEEGEPKEMMIAGLKYSYGTGGTSASVVQDDSYNAFTEVTIPATVSIDGKTYNVTAVGNNAFYGCWNLMSLTLPEGLESIGKNACSYTNIADVTLPSSLKTIGEFAFRSSAVMTLVIPEGVKTIGRYAFAYLYNLTKLELPGSLEKIGDYIIQGNEKLGAVVTHITEPFAVSNYTFATEQWNEDTQQWEYLPSPATLYVPVGTKTKYEALSGWTWFAGIEEQNEAGIATIRHKSDSNTWYNLQGVKVENPQKGVYISNGRKIILRR